MDDHHPKTWVVSFGASLPIYLYLFYYLSNLVASGEMDAIVALIIIALATGMVICLGVMAATADIY